MIRNLITARIVGADVASTLKAATDQGLTLLSVVQRGELEVQITLQEQEFSCLKGICRKRGDSLSVEGQQGIYKILRNVLARPILIAGLFMIFAVSLWLPGRVLFVAVEGNSMVATRKILETAQQCGIRFGASRRAVRSERVKNELLEAEPQLQWAGVNTRGCVAVITVRERAAGESEKTESAFGHIVALTDAYITDCTATRGTLLCTPGQAVTEGQILISGYTDTGLAIRAEQASGEIYGMTRRSVRVVMPEILTIRTATGVELKKYSLIIGKKRINLWKDSGIYGATCDRMYAEYYITLPGGFRLPLALAVERFGITQCSDRQIPANEAETVLSMFAQRSLTQTMIAGSVQERQLELKKQPGLWILAGEYRCTELIGIMQRLQIGENNGESN